MECGKCGHYYKEIDDTGNICKNYCGRICQKCGHYTPPKEELPLAKENRTKYDILKRRALDSIRKRVQLFWRNK